MTTPLTDTPTVGLGRFIKTSRFLVPSHQRDYSWTQEYVEEFLRDSEEAIKNKRDAYFCGLMVFTGTSAATFKVLDGQQRLATTLMLFSAVRNWLSSFGEYSDLKVQVNDYLGNQELGAPLEPRLSLTAANNDAFQNYVVGHVPVAEMLRAIKEHRCNDRSETLLKAAIFVNRYIERRASEANDPNIAKDIFLSLLKYLSDNVQVVRFVLPSDNAAYTIFETLNDRGLELAQLDLVKNYIFSHAEKYRPGSLSEFEGRWTEMMILLSSARADSFLRAFWASRYGKPEGATLFTAFKKEHDTPEKLYQTSLDMRRDAERYAALFNSTDPIWSKYSVDAKASVDALGTIGFTQSYPMILAALEKFDDREMERLLWLIECAAVRHQLVGRRRPGRVESLGGRTAKEIFEGRVATAKEVMAQIRELYVPDDQFRVAFEEVKETASKKVRYLLTGLERQSILRDGDTFSDELAPHNVTVEHIFPRSPSEEWKAACRDDPNWDPSLIGRLGNLCLLPGVNQSLGNKPWSDKAAIYVKSRLNGTKRLATHERWSSKEIIERQKHMAQLAIARWRFQ